MVQSTILVVLAAITTLLSTATAHMKMTTPMPYGSQSLDNSPLAADGSDFPCKLRSGVYDLDGASNSFVIGQTNTLSFEGSAVHGGGSCQVALTTDLQPTAQSTWMVIHSIQGNCPSNVTGNLPDDAAGAGAATFDYTIPQGIAPGQYTIAWAWVNKIGNREFYMNCGPATITAAAKKRYAPEPIVRRQSTFPNLFVANLQGVDNGCTTVEGVDVLYPDPGDSVENGSIGVNLKAPVGCSGVAAAAPAGNPTASAAAGSTSAATFSGSGSSTSAPSVESAATSATGGSFATGAASSAASVAPVATETVSPIPVGPTATTGSAPPAASPPASTGATGAQFGPCTDEGEWYCSSDGSSFQRCASGSWSAVIPMAAGTTCTPGLSDTLTMAKRSSSNFQERRNRRLAFGRA